MAEETRFVLSTLSFLLWGVLVMWMCAGFTMLEAGSVRTRNASVVCLKNVGLYAIAGMTFYFVGYSIMHVGVESGGWFGSLRFGVDATSAERALVRGDAAAAATVVRTGHASMSHWFFQMVFVASTASIVSGTLAERVRLWAFFLFVAVLTALIYPLVGASTWGGGWLDTLGFRDYAGSTVVHSTGAGRPSRASWSLAHAGASSGRTAASSPHRRPTSRRSRWACSSSGWDSSASTPVRGWPCPAPPMPWR